MKKTILNIQKVFQKYTDVKFALDLVAPILANEIGADRIIICNEDIGVDGKQQMKFFHQWIDKGIENWSSNQSIIINMQTVGFKDFSTSLALGKPFFFQRSNLESIYEESVRDFYLSSDVQSSAVYPIQIRGAFWGMIAFHFVEKEHEFNTEFIDWLQVFVNEVSSALVIDKLSKDFSDDIIDDQSVKMMELGRMAAGIAHEINNPVFIIGGHAARMEQILLGPKCREQKEDALKCLNTIQTYCQKITDIVDGLRMLSRDSSKEKFEVVDLNHLATILYEVSSERLMKEGIDFSLNLNDQEALVECRPGQISQVVTNLLNNAFDAISESRARNLCGKDCWIKIQTNTDDKNAYLSVIDCGKTLSPELIDKIMEPFFSTKSPGKGTGLGLSISREIIKRFDGELSVDKEHRNVKFDIRLPLISFEEE
jgi:signal transduction histidine kinase